jgi:hypothetical protein
MVGSTAITDAIYSLNDLSARFNLRQADSDRFFHEWREDLPELNELEKVGVSRLKQRYDYQRMDGLLLEGTIQVAVVSPLLELAGFLDAPYRMHSPYGIMLELDDSEEKLRGFIDVLVIQKQLWILVVESKRTSISVLAAMPQLLAYMLASPNGQSNKPSYGLATNGDEFVFLKMTHDETPKYDVSRTFSLFPRQHELGQVLQILKRLGLTVLENP